MTGAFLFTDDGTSFVAVWGQDENADPALPSIDVGISLIPLRSLTLQKVFILTRDVDCTGTATPRDTVRFRLQFFNDSADPLSNIIVEDNLPSSVTYIPNSTLLNGSPIADGGATAFPLDEGGYQVGTLNPRSTGSLTFDTVINDATVAVTNRADIRSSEVQAGAEFAVVDKPVQAPAPQYAVEKTLIAPANGEVSGGQTVSFGLTVINTGAIPITKLPLQDTFDATYLTFLNANPPPDTIAPGVISWNDLIPGLGGSLAPGAAVNLSVAFRVNSIAGATQSTNTASAVGAEISGGIILPPCIDTAALNLTSAPTPSPPDNDDEPPATATPMPIASPTSVALAPSPPGPTPTIFPVSFLPETGSRSEKMLTKALLLLTLLAISAAALWLRQRSKRKDLF